MSMDLIYYGQNVGITVPDIALSGDPAVDQAKCIEKGFIGGRIMAIKDNTSTPSASNGERSLVIVPCDGGSMMPFGTLLNGPGEYATSIGVSGSKKAPVVRAMPVFNVSADCYVATDKFVEGAPLYAGFTNKSTGDTSNIGKWTMEPAAIDPTKPFVPVVCGICTHVPTTSEPYLGVAQCF